MKNNDSKTALVIVCVIVIGFLIFAIINIANSTKNVRNNTVIDNDIYEEEIDNNHPDKEPTTVPPVQNIKKEYVEIAKYSTNIYDKDKNRIYNIKLACSRIDGHVIKSGEEFSFNSLLGNMGEAEGYKKALGFDSNGGKIKVFGGGICQISSTLYNAALIARLEITERHAHSRRVYYVPKNKDATVFAGGPDLKFINNRSNNVKIEATTDGYTVTTSLKEEKIKQI